nr:SH3 domain-containing protein [Propionicimonas sp.]
MYEPRRVADPTAQEASDRPRGTATRADHHTPRHAVPGVGDRIFARGGIALAAITASATAGAVVVGSTADPAVAMGAVPGQVPSVQLELAAALEQPAVRTLTADQLAAPATITAKRAAKALVSHTPLYTTASVNVRKQASEKSDLLGQLQLGVRVSATAEIDGKYRKVEYDKGYGWVLEAELSDAAPIEAAGTTWAACSRGSAVERKLRKDTVHIYRSVCALFPAVNSYGGWRAGGLPFHKNGRALDIMLTPRAESALGHRIAKYLIAHAKVFNIDHIIFEQHIWTPSTPRWRKMADRGSLNANHFNHVHVAIRA